MILGVVGSSEAVLTAGTWKSLKDTESQSAGLTYFRSSLVQTCSNHFELATPAAEERFSNRVTLRNSSGDMPVSQPLRCGSGRCEPCVEQNPFAGPSQTIGDLPVLTVEYCGWLARVFYLFLCPTHIWYKIHTTVRMHDYVALQVCDLEEHVGVYCTVDRATHSLRTCLLWNMACSWMKLTLSVRRRRIAAMDNGSQS